MFPYVNDVREILFYIQYRIVNVVEMQTKIFIRTIVKYCFKIQKNSNAITHLIKLYSVNTIQYFEFKYYGLGYFFILDIQLYCIQLVLNLIHVYYIGNLYIFI